MSYKVWVLNNNAIENVFIFGEKRETAFSDDDLEMMMEFGFDINSPIICDTSPVQIHKDDSIMQIKKKILNEMGRDSGATYHELYMFAYVEKIIDPYSIFYETVAKNTNYLTRNPCTQLLHNLMDDFEPLDENVDVFSYKDFSSVVGPYRKQNVPIGLGVVPPVSGNDHLFSANPFYAVEYSARNAVHTDAVLLFNHGTIVDNNIFVCLAGDVFAAFPEQTEFLAKTYYPLLATRSIFETESLLEKRDQLVSETDKIMNPRHFGAYEIVDMFYDIYKNTRDDFDYRVNGVRRFEIAIKPSYSFVMPIETIFKNVHATSKYKFMKLNLGMRRENIFRIYSDKISKTGRKIPALPREKINSLSKNMGKQKQMSVFVEESNLSIDIDADGTIYISWGTKNKTATQYLNIREIEALLLADVNPLLETINLYLQRSGYEIPMIEAITDPNIEIKSMDYVASIVLKKKLKKGGFQLKQDIGCLYSVFDVVSDFEKGTTAQLRFKRVNNYREMDQQTLLITETFNKKGRESDVLEALIANHGMTVEEAGNRIGQYLKDMEYRKIDGTTIEVVENPGLPIEMKIEQTDDLSGGNKLDFIVENISNLGYIESLSVYFESTMRILQDMKTPGVSKERIAQMCKPFKASDSKQGESEGEREDMRLTQPAPVVHERVAAFDFSPTSPMPEYEDNAEMSPRAKSNFKNIQDLLEVTEDAEGNYKFNSDESSDLDLTGVEVEEGGKESSDLDLTGVEVEGEDDEMYGGAPSLPSGEETSSEENELGVKNKDRAKNTNPFLKELQKKDPAVILQGKDGRSNIYARSCQSYRQPVVLTKAEKERIDRKSPGSYTKAMKYGSTPENEHYYICPRFWCFKNNVSMTEEQVRNGECEKEYLFEFKNKNNPIEHEDAEGNYIKHYPGFIKKPGLKHCMPCCFASAWETWSKKGANQWENQNKTIRWDDAGNKFKRTGKGDWVKQDIDGKEKIDETGTVWLMDVATGEWRVNPDEREQPRQSDKCLTEMDNANKGNEDNVEATDMSIRNPDTKRVAKGKLAFLQYAVQHFLNVDYTGKVKTVNGTKYLSEGVETYLRYGTEQFDPESETSNSLLGCIADLLGPNPPKVKTGQFGKMLADAVSVDEFVRFGNASFTAIFRPEAIEIGDKMAIIDENGVKSMTINLDDYSDSELYKRMNTVDANDTDALSSFWEMFAAYEMYKLYLSNPEITVDYTYVWDLISRPNPKLFEKGINLVIMELPRNDITDSIDLICPTNTYTKTKFDVDKPTAFLVKSTYQNEPLFEPVYLYNSKTKTPTRTFTKSSAHLRPIIQMLNKTLNNYCKPKQSLPDVYEYKQSILLEDLVNILKEVKYTVLKQVLNYQGKAIALLVSAQAAQPTAPTPILVPCAPSAPLTNMTVAYMDDESLWTTYEKTRAELSRLHAASNGEIPCNPMLKMIEGPMIVGLLTWSNQMIPINPPTNDVPGDGLKSMSINKTIFQTDDALTKTEQGDTDREKIVRNARIESEMYALFRTTVKTLLAKPANYRIRDRLINETMTRKQRIKYIVNELVKLTRKSVTFKTFGEDVLETMGKMDAIEYDCGGNKKSAFLKDGCQLILPLNNILVPTRDNRILYFYRIADELLRFKEQSDFILYPKQIMNTGNTEYKVKQDEFIVLESSLSSDYYDNQTELPINQYMSGEIPYEMATAEKMVKESNVVTIETQGPDILNNCEEKRTDLEGQPDKTYWIKEVFKAKRGNQYEMHFKGGPDNETCSFGPFLKIANELDNTKFDNIDDVRQLVWESYRDLITPEEDETKQRNFDKIIALLRNNQGKTGLLTGVNTVAQFEDVVRSDAYFMTTLDLYVLAQKQGLPIILFSNSKEGGVKKSLDDIGFESDNWLILGKRNPRSADNKFYFVRAQKKIDGKKNPNSTPSFSMVYKPFGLSELNDLSDKIQSAFQGKDFKGNMLSIEEFLQ